MRKLQKLLLFFLRLWNASNWAAGNTNRVPGDFLSHLLCKLWVCYPQPIPLEGAFGDALFSVSVCVYTGISPVSEFE